MANTAGQQKLLATLEQLLTIEGTSLRSALDQATDLIASAISADKTDAFLYEPSIESLVALGTSNTPMGIRERQIGLDRLPLANGGPETVVFRTGEPYHTGRADNDPTIPRGLIDELGVRSTIIAPLIVNAERRGVIQACSAHENAFSEDDLSFLQAVGYWVGAIAHRAELVERIKQDATAQARQVAAEEIITVLAHDLSNYITPLKGRIDFIAQRAGHRGDNDYLNDAESASRALQRLRAIITDLLDIGRLDQGIFALNRQVVDLTNIVNEVTGAMQTRQLNIIVRAPDELRVEADPARMRQALENLVANALKHSPQDVPIDINVKSERRDDGEWAIVSISDEGPGIAPEIVPRLFSRFGAGPGSTGLGLGLYLARSITEAHGGTLTVTSKLGQGTSFQLAIPCNTY